MYSNSPKESLIEEREELKKVRALLVTSIISYPIWGLLAKYLVPNGYDPLWQRLACSFISLILLALTFRKDHSGIKVSHFNRTVYLYSYHLLFLYCQNADSVYYVIFNLIQFPYAILCFTSKKEAQFYILTKFMAIGVIALFLSYENINPWFFLISMVTIGQYMITVVTKQLNVVENLRKVKSEFDLALSNMTGGVVMMNKEGKIVSYNDSAADILRLPKTHVSSLSFEDTYLYKESVSDVSIKFDSGDHPLEKVLQEETPAQGIIMGITIDQERLWLLINLRPLPKSDQILISFSDITEMRRNQELKEIGQAQKAMNAKLSSLFKVAGGIAHEINNPLSVITTRLQSLEKRLDGNQLDESLLKTTIEKSLKAAFRISQVVASLLALSKNADENPMDLVRLSEVIEPALNLCREHFKSHDVELVIDDVPNLSLFCRPTQISQVFYNLLTNALEATLNQDIKWARFSFKEVDNKIYITVSDSGPRIPEAVQQRMMEPFYTTKEIGKGAGLGLSVSKAIIEEHKGNLTFEEDALNTSFIITLNVAESDSLTT